MLKHRVIPCLLLKNDGLVKTKKFTQPKYVGDPINAIRIFNDKEVDELIFLDIDASKKGSEPNFKLIEQIAGECFMPLCYGGGIRTVAQAQRLFSMGVEKVCLQAAAFDDLSIINSIANRFGTQSVLVSVDLKKNWLGKHRLYHASSGKCLAEDWMSFVERAVKAGAGEIVINSVDNDGTMRGMDLESITKICQKVSVPVIAMGGVGSLQDIKLAVEAGASAVAAGSYFVFHGTHRAVLITYPNYNELENLF
ncbi:MAG: AglZ/HisF2 family acetamidino modification protein [Gammaproteobacteria bacterium]|nr:AglZ/HisF2 family acetamidino modification protein [Gammaproteobacteria bacterium]